MNQITEESFEDVLRSLVRTPQVNLKDVTYIDPFGMIGLLIFGEMSKKNGTKKSPSLILPQAEAVSTSLDLMDFITLAGAYYQLQPPGLHSQTKRRRSAPADALLKITPIRTAADVEAALETIREQGQTILAKELGYDEKAMRGFCTVIAELCTNIVEHSEKKGYIGIQRYFLQDLSKKVVKIAVMDTGIGFKDSLSDRFLLRNDLHALEIALLQGASRHVDESKGRGLETVRRFVTRYNGKFFVRSGTARLSLLPKWAKGSKKDFNLPFFPGSQIGITLPAI